MYSNSVSPLHVIACQSESEPNPNIESNLFVNEAEFRKDLLHNSYQTSLGAIDWKKIFNNLRIAVNLKGGFVNCG